MTSKQNARSVLVLTIGQSPRTDLIPAIAKQLPEIAFVERGLLDELDADNIAALTPGHDDEVLVTRLADGSSVQISEAWATAHMAERIALADQESYSAIFVACSGTFPVGDQWKVPVVFPDRVLGAFVWSVASGFRTVHVVVPDANQTPNALEKFTRLTPGSRTTVSNLDPYNSTTDDWTQLAIELQRLDATFVVLDCIGYTMEQATALSLKTGAVVVTARSAAAAALGLLVQEMGSLND